MRQCGDCLGLQAECQAPRAAAAASAAALAEASLHGSVWRSGLKTIYLLLGLFTKLFGMYFKTHNMAEDVAK